MIQEVTCSAMWLAVVSHWSSGRGTLGRVGARFRAKARCSCEPRLAGRERAALNWAPEDQPSSIRIQPPMSSMRC